MKQTEPLSSCVVLNLSCGEAVRTQVNTAGGAVDRKKQERVPGHMQVRSGCTGWGVCKGFSDEVMAIRDGRKGGGKPCAS